MAVVTRYETPAALRDVPEGSGFYDAWHTVVDDAVSVPAASPWIDPVLVDPDVITVRMLSWIGFPRATLTVERRDDRTTGFVEAEDRSRQFEYFEWHTTRDATGKVTKVAFTTETPEYFVELAKVDPDRVVALYQEHVDPAVQKDDLFDAAGTYNPNNRWTTTDGVMHFVNSINNIPAAIGLARTGTGEIARDNFELAAKGPHAADDYIMRETALLGRAGFDVTVHEPVGLYIDGWDDAGWTKPDGSPVGDYWRITRGKPGAVLRVEYEVPEGEGFVVGDIRIGGRPVLHGGQLAEHMTSSLPVVVARRSS